MTGKRKAQPSGEAAAASGSASGAATKRTWAERLTFRNRPKRTWKQRLKRFVVFSLVSGLVLVLIGVATFIWLYKSIDIPEANPEFLTQTTFVYYDDGTELGKYNTELRERVGLSDIADDLKEAVVAAENRTFYSDNGIDLKGIARAIVNNASGNSKQGASTITQQYVKILYLTQERSYTRKVKEAILALKIQREKSKDEVLEDYLNIIYFGRGAYGVEAAANVYFDRSAKDLNLRQSAVIAALLNNPSGLDPANGRDAQRALRGRYDYVLDSMLETGKITTGEATAAKERLPKIKEPSSESTYGGQRGHVLKLVEDQVLSLTDDKGDPLFTEDQIDGGGLRITTTLDQKAMDAASQGVEDAKPEGFGDKQLHIGVASVEPGTGALRGFYAGQDYLDSEINWAVAGGQAGSTFKAFALAAGIKDGYSLKDTFDGNSPYVYNDVEVENEFDTDYGRVNLITATEKSINSAFTDLTVAMDDGPQKIVDMANAMGIPPEKGKDTVGFPDHTDGLRPETTVALGSATVSPINMANGYATIANGGVAADPYLIEKVESPTGEVLYQHQVQTHRAMSSDIAADVSYALQQVVESPDGTGNAAEALDRPAAGKTGTATNGKGEVSSAWFSGFTPQMATAVMYVRGQGNEQLKGWLPEYFGGAFPTRTWTAVMRYEMEGLPVKELPDPVYVDGEAPQEGHAPYTPPPPPTRKPSKTPSSAPTSEEPTTEPTEPSTAPTTAPTSEPTSEPPPTGPCGLLLCPSSSPPPTSDPPTSDPTSAPPTSKPPAPSASPAARTDTTAAPSRRRSTGLLVSW